MKLTTLPVPLLAALQALLLYVWLFLSFALFAGLTPVTPYPGVAWLLFSASVLPPVLFGPALQAWLSKKLPRAKQLIIWQCAWLLLAFFVTLQIDSLAVPELPL